MRHLVVDLERIPGVVAVTLGGSRATGTATEGSDWDFGLVLLMHYVDASGVHTVYRSDVKGRMAD